MDADQPAATPEPSLVHSKVRQPTGPVDVIVVPANETALVPVAKSVPAVDAPSKTFRTSPGPTAMTQESNRTWDSGPLLGPPVGQMVVTMFCPFA
jgi:hypothetical protein